MNAAKSQQQTPKLGPPPSGYEAPMKYAQLQEAIKNDPNDIVERFLSAMNIDVLIGDSGLGKTPLAVQLGLCIASGIPFLGMPVQRAAILYVDYENGRRPYERLLERLSLFLGMPGVPDTFRYMQGGSKAHVLYAIRQLHEEFPSLPIVVIFDTMRGFDAKLESKNENAADEITKLRASISKPLNVSFLLIHHIRKSSDDPSASTPLFSTDIMKWLERASGARAVINQSNFRIGFDQHNMGQAERVIKGHCKLIGPFGPILIARVYDDEGEAIGWKRLSGVALVSTVDGERDKFVSLPDEFTFKQVEAKAGNPKKAAAWLQAWQGFGVIRKEGKTKSKHAHYVKTPDGKTIPKAPIKTADQKFNEWLEKAPLNQDFEFMTIVAATGLSRDTVMNRVARAVKADLLRRVDNGQRLGAGSVYRRTIPPAVPEPVPDGASVVNAAGKSAENASVSVTNDEADIWGVSASSAQVVQ